MTDTGFDSPESGAMVGFPPEFCRPIATRVSGDDAYVLLNTGSMTQTRRSTVVVAREGRRHPRSADDDTARTVSCTSSAVQTLGCLPVEIRTTIVVPPKALSAD